MCVFLPGRRWGGTRRSPQDCARATERADVESTDSWSETLTAAQAGDPSACGALWRTYAPAVVAFARARGSREPEDLTSEVFLTVFRRLSDLTGGPDAFRAFVFTVAHRRLVDERRRHSRRGETATWSEETDRRTCDSTETVVLEAMGSAEARRMIEALAPDQRDVLTLRIFGDLTVEHVAAVLGKRPGAVKALQRRGLEALRRMTAQSGGAAALAAEGRR